VSVPLYCSARREVGQAAAAVGFPDASAVVAGEESQLAAGFDGHLDLGCFAVPGGIR
jgi:hypothetical protein